MNWTSLFVLICLSIFSIGQAAPIPVPPVSHAESLFNFRNELENLEEKLSESAAKSKNLGKGIKIATVSTSVLGLLGGIGYIISSAIPMQVQHQQHKYIQGLNDAVNQANMRTAFSKSFQESSVPRIKKRENLGSAADAAKDIIQEGTEHAESFRSALSRLSSGHFDEIEDHDLHHMRYAPFTVSPIRAFTSEPAAFTHEKIAEAIYEKARAEDEAFKERLSLIQQQVLASKRRELEAKKKKDKLALGLLGLGLTTAVAGIASAELVIQNSVEYYLKRYPGTLPDVSALTPDECAAWKMKIPALDCSKANGQATSSNPVPKSVTSDVGQGQPSPSVNSNTKPGSGTEGGESPVGSVPSSPGSEGGATLTEDKGPKTKDPAFGKNT